MLKYCLQILLLICFACNKSVEVITNEPHTLPHIDSTDSTKPSNVFDKAKWMVRKGKGYLYRDEMLHALIYDHHLREIKRDSLLLILGKPDRVDSNYLFYRTSAEQIGFFTLHARSLVIKLSPDSTVEWMKIHE